MMKKIIFALMITAILLLPVVLAGDKPLREKTFIHYENGRTEVVTSQATVCTIGFLASSQPKLLSTATYSIDPSNKQGLSQSFITNAIQAGAETWDAATSKELFNGAVINKKAKFGVFDGVNTIAFGQLQRGVIGVTRVWYYPDEIVEFDMKFNTAYLWADCTETSCTNKMDLKNIATHEFGHTTGLDDSYDSVCSQATMFGYSSYGETQKRDLAQPDITGLQILYGA